MATRKRAAARKRATTPRRPTQDAYDDKSWGDKVVGEVQFGFSKEADNWSGQNFYFQAWRHGDKIWLNIGCQGPYTLAEWQSDEGIKRLVNYAASEVGDEGDVSVDDYSMREEIAEIIRTESPSPERDEKIAKVALQHISITEPTVPQGELAQDIARRLAALCVFAEAALPQV